MSVASGSDSPPNQGKSVPEVNPVKGNGNGSRSGGGSTGNGKRKGGSMLGIAGAQPIEEGSLTWSFSSNEGKEVQVNIFENVFSDGKMDAGKLEMVLNYMEASGKLDFTAFIEGIVYQGFDRLYFIRAALKRVSISQFSRFAILGAVRGSNFDKISEKCLNMPQDLSLLVKNNIVIKKASKRDDLTILRFTASIPHWVAHWLFKVNIAKKIESQQCPGWLQFPGAASLPMSKEIRLQHIAFCKAFSSLLPGGRFNGNIYYTAFSNPIPEKEIPSMLKDFLGIGAVKTPTISPEEVRESVSMEVARVTK